AVLATHASPEAARGGGAGGGGRPPAALADHRDVAREEPVRLEQRRAEGREHRQGGVDDADAVRAADPEAGGPARLHQRPLPLPPLLPAPAEAARPHPPPPHTPPPP